MKPLHLAVIALFLGVVVPLKPGSSVTAWGQAGPSDDVKAQVQQELDAAYRKQGLLVETLKRLVTCKIFSGYRSGDGDLYCSLSFRGLYLDFAGVNAKYGGMTYGGTIYVKTLGKIKH